MRISKLINNNLVSSFDKENEVIIMGRGIGYGKKPGMLVDNSKIEKIFRMDSRDETKHLQELLQEVPIERIRIVDQIIEEAQKQIKDRMQRSIYITLIDHINFAIERQKQNIEFHNLLANEVKRFYPVEYELGKEAIELIENNMGISLPEDEAAAIALHFVNAEFGKGMQKTINVTKIIQNSLKIVKYFYNMEIDENSLNYERFVTHMKFFAQRAVARELLHSVDQVLNSMIRTQYPKAYQCAEKLANYIENEYNSRITLDELTYLAVHIERITNNNYNNV